MMGKLMVVYNPVKHSYTLRDGEKTLACYLQCDYLRSRLHDALSFEQCAQLYFFPIEIIR